MGEVRFFFIFFPPLGVELIHRTFASNKLRWQMSWEWSCWIVSNVKMRLRPLLPGAFYNSFTVICIPQLCSRWRKRWFFFHLILSEPAGLNNKTTPCPWLKLGYYGKLSPLPFSLYESPWSHFKCFGIQMLKKNCLEHSPGNHPEQTVHL